MSGAGAAIIWCPVASLDEAKAIARLLVSEKQVACVNILPGATSVFSYGGDVQVAEEVILVCKTQDALLDRAMARICELHSYEVPAICGWRADKAPEITLEWLSDVTSEGDSGAAN